MRSSPLQFQAMVSFMEEHGDLCHPSCKHKGKIEGLILWEKLTALLNSDKSGSKKTTEKWKKVWCDFKNNTKKKANRLYRASIGVNDGPTVYAKLTDLEQRVLNLIKFKPPHTRQELTQEDGECSGQDPFDWNIGGESSDITTVIINKIDENVVPWSEPSPPQPTVRVISTSALNQMIEEREDPDKSPQSEAWVEIPDEQPALSGHTETQGTPRQHPQHPQHLQHPHITREISPQRCIRRPRTARRLRSSECLKHLVRCQREWRRFRMEQHRDSVELKREQNRIRELELQVQKDWQTVALRGLGVIEKMCNHFCKD